MVSLLYFLSHKNSDDSLPHLVAWPRARKISLYAGSPLEPWTLIHNTTFVGSNSSKDWVISRKPKPTSEVLASRILNDWGPKTPLPSLGKPGRHERNMRRNGRQPFLVL